MMTANLFVIANVKYLWTGGSFRILVPFFRTSWCVGVLNSAIFNSFHNRVDFGTILESLRNIGGGGLNPQPPSPHSVRQWATVPNVMSDLPRLYSWQKEEEFVLPWMCVQRVYPKRRNRRVYHITPYTARTQRSCSAPGHHMLHNNVIVRSSYVFQVHLLTTGWMARVRTPTGRLWGRTEPPIRWKLWAHPTTREFNHFARFSVTFIMHACVLALLNDGEQHYHTRWQTLKR